MLEALTAEESAIYGAFLSSSDLVVHKPEQKIGKFASALGLRTLADHSPEEAALAASRMVRVFSTCHANANIVSASSEMPSDGIIFLAESNQEIMDSVILAYRISEDPKMRMHASVVYEYPKFIETVQLPNISAIKSFLPKKSSGSIGNEKNCLSTITKVEEAWKKKFHRAFGLIEGYKIEDAKQVLVMSGFHFPTCKVVVDNMRSKGNKVGALRIRTLSPFPSEQITKHLAGKEFSVLDNEMWGPVLSSKMKAKSSFKYNKYMTKADFFNIFANLGKEGSFEIK